MEKTPRQLAEERIGLAEEYSRYSGLLAELIKKRAEHYKAHRPNAKSDTAVEREWENTEVGVQMTIIKMKLKSIEKKLSASNTMLRLMENESKNLY
jgi:hypothetical protein